MSWTWQHPVHGGQTVTHSVGSTSVISEMQNSPNALSVAISAYLPVCLYDALLCGLILLFDFFLFFSLFNFIFIFSVLSFLTEWKLGVLHWPAMPIQGKALLPSLKERVQHCTLDLCKSHNSDACLDGPSGGLKGFIWINCEILFISVV